MPSVGKITRASDGRLVWFSGTDAFDRTRVVSFPPGSRYLDGIGSYRNGVGQLEHTVARDVTGHSSTDPWWADYEDHRRPGADEWSGWDETAEEGPDEGPPYVGAGTKTPYDKFFTNPKTGTYHRDWPPTRAEPDPRDIDAPSATWTAIRRTAAADPNPLLGLGQDSGPSKIIAVGVLAAVLLGAVVLAGSSR